MGGKAARNHQRGKACHSRLLLRISWPSSFCRGIELPCCPCRHVRSARRGKARIPCLGLILTEVWLLMYSSPRVDPCQGSELSCFAPKDNCLGPATSG